MAFTDTHKTENRRRFKTLENSVEVKGQRAFGIQNNLNQISTHFKMGKMGREFTTSTGSQFRDNSQEREKGLFVTRNVKDYQEKSHFGLGQENYPKLTTTWTAFSKKLEKPRGLMGL